MKLKRTAKPRVELAPVGDKTIHNGRTFQTYLATNPNDTRTWEHDETKDEWWINEEE